MDIRITKPPKSGALKAIPSKSAAHRILIAAYMSGLDISDKCAGLSADITATVNCLTAMSGSGRDVQLPCGESGSTLRFLIPLAGVLGIESDFICEGRLPYRPMEEFLTELEKHGAKVTGLNPKHLTGKLRGGEYRLPGNISSQYFTGLLMALPAAEDDSEIIVEGRLESRPYIDITLGVFRKAGIVIEETEQGFAVAGNQKYCLSEEELNNIEGDWSNAAFWLVSSYLLDKEKNVIDVTGLDMDSLQGDRKIRQIVNETRQAGNLKMTVDVADIPDLVPAIALMSCGRPEGSVTDIVGAGRLRMKESDRLTAVTEVLTILGADIEEGEESLHIVSRGRLSGGRVDSFNDHRIAMMAAIASCISDGAIEISLAEAVNKSYPRFYDDFRSLGGNAEWLEEVKNNDR